MQKGEWLPFSLLSAFCILHSAFCISTQELGRRTDAAAQTPPSKIG